MIVTAVQHGAEAKFRRMSNPTLPFLCKSCRP